MNIEVEIKIKVDSLQEIRKKVSALGKLKKAIKQVDEKSSKDGPCYNCYNVGQRVKANNTVYPNKYIKKSSKDGPCYNCYNVGQRVKANNTVYPNKYLNTDGTPTKNIYLNDQLVATVKGIASSAVMNYSYADHLNSTNITADINGNITETIDYYPYGSVRTNTGSNNSQKQYIGQYFDDNTSLNYLNARYYKSVVGQFVSQDPVFWNFDQAWLLDPQNQNSYSYARDNPINRSDPSGKASNKIISSIKSHFKSLRDSLRGGQTNQSSQKTATPSSGIKLVSFKGSNFINSTEKVPVSFTFDLSRINNYASENNVQLNIQSSGVRIKEAPIPGDVYHKQGEITQNSAHYVGMAIDMKVQYKNTNNENSMCDNLCLNSGYNFLPNPVQGFIGSIRNDTGLRWGGDFKRTDGVHIDNGIYQRDPVEYLRLFNILQNK